MPPSSKIDPMTPSLRTPLAGSRGLGSARSGTEEWWQQRGTAIALVPLTVAFVVLMIRLIGADYDETARAMGNFYVATLTLIFVGAFTWHLKLGLCVIIDDYVHLLWLRLSLRLAATFGCAVMVVSCAVSLAKHATRF